MWDHSLEFLVFKFFMIKRKSTHTYQRLHNNLVYVYGNYESLEYFFLSFVLNIMLWVGGGREWVCVIYKLKFPFLLTCSLMRTYYIQNNYDLKEDYACKI